jgi:hypothetical protein
MAYSAFKSLDELKQPFSLQVNSAGSLFADVPVILLSDALKTILEDQIPLALNINTEKARSELIISPLLVEVRRLLNRQISLFSGIDFNVDDTRGLNGFCDFILSKSPDQVFLEKPVICVVEAKNENIKSGFAQCAAEMIAAQLFNHDNVTPIYGVVTTGSNWKFLKLEQQTLFIDYDEYLISQADKILAILSSVMR